MTSASTQHAAVQPVVSGGPQPTELYREYRRSRDPRVREAIVRMHVGLVRRLAARFAYRGEELDDLVQVACCGLLHAIERFDPDRGTAFTTFARLRSGTTGAEASAYG